jgi:hypothetical protein
MRKREFILIDVNLKEIRFYKYYMKQTNPFETGYYAEKELKT